MENMKIALYLVSLFTCLACTILLFRAYLQRKVTLLLWSSICFVGLTISNLLLVIDLAVLPSIDLRLIRLIFSLGGMLFLLYGFIWETE